MNEHVIRFPVLSGDYSGEVTPVPISNTVVKLLSADDTWWEAAWKSRTPPVRKEGSYEPSFFSCFPGLWLKPGGHVL